MIIIIIVIIITITMTTITIKKTITERCQVKRDKRIY